jgi:hypothetical protein
MVVAIIALVVARGGSAYAIRKVGTKQLKNGSVSTRKIRNGAVTEAKIAPGARNKVVAYATVGSLGQVIASESSGAVTSSNVDRHGAAYCFHGLGFPFTTAVATPRHGDNEAGPNVTISAQVDRSPFETADCDATPGAQLEVSTSIGDIGDVSGFVVAFLR